jgi:hypothetical protein
MEKRLAKVISVIFYPLFIPTYAFAVLLAMPTYFSALLPASSKLLLVGLIFTTTCVFPTLIYLVMIKTKIVGTTWLSNKEDRTLPYTVSIIFFYLAYYMLKRLGVPPVLTYFMIGATFLNVLVMGINFFWKISSHMASVGAFVGIAVGLSYFLGTFYFSLIAASLLVAGVVGYARLKLEAHTNAQIYTGFLLGFLSMVSLFLVQI